MEGGILQNERRRRKLAADSSEGIRGLESEATGESMSRSASYSGCSGSTEAAKQSYPFAGS